MSCVAKISNVFLFQVEQLLGDPTKAKTKLGWTPRVSADDGHSFNY